MIIVKQVFLFIFILPLLNEIIVLVDKNPL